jgi:hypothetical protein
VHASVDCAALSPRSSGLRSACISPQRSPCSSRLRSAQLTRLGSAQHTLDCEAHASVHSAAHPRVDCKAYGCSRRQCSAQLTRLHSARSSRQRSALYHSRLRSPQPTQQWTAQRMHASTHRHLPHLNFTLRLYNNLVRFSQILERGPTRARLGEPGRDRAQISEITPRRRFSRREKRFRSTLCI